MSTLCDITADLPPAANLRAVGGLTAEEAASLAEELTAYHHHFASFFYRREQRQWAEVYLRGLLTADVPRKNVEAMALRLLGGDHMRSDRCAPSSSSLGKAPGTIRRSWPSTSAW
jgi:hypothetical protein